MTSKRSFLLPLFVSIATLAALMPISVLIQANVVSWDTVLLVAVPGVLGAGLALAGLSRPASLLLTCLACLATLGWRGLGLLPELDPAHWLTAWGELSAEGIRSLSRGTPNLEASPAVLWLVLLLTATTWILTTMFAESLEQPAWTVSTLALPFGITALIQPAEVPFVLFLPVAIGYAAVLLAAPRPGTSGFEGARWVLGGVAAALAITLALATSSLIPLGSKQPWRSGMDDKPIQLSDPTIDLAENLHRPEPTDVLTYTSSDGAPHYLRTTAMSKLTSNGAQLDSMKLRTGDISGAYDFPGQRVELNVSMRFPSQYLPMPFSPERFEAEGRWAWDPETLSVVATGTDGAQQSSELNYRTVSVVPEADAATISRAAAGQSPDGERSLEVPADIPAEVTDLLAEITAGANTDGEKALALVRFFQSDEFTYTLNAPNSSDSGTLTSFLLEDRSGYCIHFSISMALLARMLDIPSRVAVGFTGGTAQGDSFVVTTDNMHAWPELYFEGLGWVPFEPTKSYDTGAAEPQSDPAQRPSPTSTPTTPQQSPSPSPTVEPSQAESAQPSSSPSGQPVSPPGSAGGTGSQPWLPLVLGALGVLLVLSLPALLSWARRWWRLRPSQGVPELASAAWRETRDTFTDLGLTWQSGSPVAAAETMGSQLYRGAAEQLVAVAALVEQSLYARQAPDVQQLPSLTRRARRQLLAGAPALSRVFAVLMPRSLLRRRS